MSHITEKDLDHLAKLCRLQLSTEDKTKLLSQLDNILALVEKLQTCDTSDVKNTQYLEKQTPLHTGVIDAHLAGSILKNVKHPLRDHAIEITGKLKDVKEET